MHVERHQQPDSAHDCDPRRVEVRHRVEEEGHDDTPEHHHALDQQPPVRDRVHFLELGDVDIEAALDRVSEVPHQEVEDERARDHHARAEVDKEGVEVEVLCEHVPDDDVRRVADHRRRSTQVREDRLGDEVRAGVDVDQLAQLAGHRTDEEDGRDVVEEGREHGRDEAEEEQQLRLVAPRELARHHPGPLEDTGAHGDAHDKHHAPEEPEGPVVHPAHHLGEGRRAVLHREDDHAHCRPDHRRHRPVQHLSHDETEDDRHDDPRDHHLHGPEPAERVQRDRDRQRLLRVGHHHEDFVIRRLVDLKLEEERQLLGPHLVRRDQPGVRDALLLDSERLEARERHVALLPPIVARLHQKHPEAHRLRGILHRHGGVGERHAVGRSAVLRGLFRRGAVGVGAERGSWVDRWGGPGGLASAVVAAAAVVRAVVLPHGDGPGRRGHDLDARLDHG
mmetsp:Transcript_31506/g.74877  ORF Transcript_31506/g.74877 Transcript_31506/m.74877 type:complete len:450 (-) Transcript_31506:587-1936(-)